MIFAALVHAAGRVQQLLARFLRMFPHRDDVLVPLEMQPRGGDAELVLSPPCCHVLVGPGVDVGVDAQRHAGPLAEAGAKAVEVLQLGGRLDVEEQDALPKPRHELLLGLPDPLPAFRPGRLAAVARRNPDRDEFVRATVAEEDGEPVLAPVSGQESHMIVRAGRAAALAWIPAGEGELAAGAPVRFLPL